MFSNCRCVSVIFDKNFQAGTLRKDFSNRGIMPIQIGSKNQETFIQFNRSRYGKRKTQYSITHIMAKENGFIDKLKSLIESFFLRSCRVSRNVLSKENLTHKISQDNRNEIYSQFHTDNPASLRIDF